MSKILHPFEDTSSISTSLESRTLSDSDIPESLVITVDATHSGYKNKNCFYYDSEAMKYAVRKDVWTKPYPRPLLKNHDMDSEPLGRVVQARFIDTDNGKGFTQLDVKVTDKEAIEKIMDGRYLTVSTSGTPMKDASGKFNFTLCSVCGVDLNRDDFCGHSRGRVYEDDDGVMKMCFWKVGAIDYKEVSIVNTPADNDGNTAAQITNIAMIDGEEEIDLSKLDNLPINKSNVCIFADNEVSYIDTIDFDEKQVANKDLWDSVKKDKQKYIDNKGLVFNKEDKVTNNSDEKVEPEGEAPVEEVVVEDKSMKETTPSWIAEDIKLTSSTKGGHNFSHHHAVYYEDELGNGYTDYILGHSHAVVDNSIKTGVIENTGKTHNHKITTEKVSIGIDKKLLDKEAGHRHSIYLNEAGNGWSSFVDGHSHSVVNGKVIEDAKRDSEDVHSHSLIEWPESEVEDVSSLFASINDIKHKIEEGNLEDGITEYLQQMLSKYYELENAAEQVQVKKILDAIINCS